MARSFHEITGETVQIYAATELAATRYSKIAKVTIYKGLDTDPTFIQVMKDLISEYQRHDEPVILISCGNRYADLIAKHREELTPAFICPGVSYELLQRLTDDNELAKICAEHELPYAPAMDIPGDITNLKVLNAYADKHHHVKLLSLGQPVLMDSSPKAFSNYLAVMPEFNQEIYDYIQRFLEDIEFTGFVNFEIKFDKRDEKYKVTSIGAITSRSSYYVTLNGNNLAQLVIDDYVNDTLDAEPTVYANKNKAQYKLWLGVPTQTFTKYAPDNIVKEEAIQLIKQDRMGSTVIYDKDQSAKRWLLLGRMFYNYLRRFKKYSKK